MRVVFMGTPDFAVPALKQLGAAGYPVVAVVTQPDRPRGRGKKVHPSPVKQAALELNLPVLQPQRVKEAEFIQTLKKLAPDVIVVAAFGQILPKEILQLPKHGCINIHASLLPRYRGAAPIHRAVMNGESETGITTMLMDEGLDTGDILLKASITISDQDNVGSVHDRLASMGADLLLKTLALLSEGRLLRQSQDGNKATYASMLTREDEEIKWDNPSRQIFNHVRGMDPWPGARTDWDRRVLKIWRVELPEQTTPVAIEDTPVKKGVPGQVLGIAKNGGLLVQTGDKPVVIAEMQLQGGKRLPASALLRGNPIVPGTIFGNEV